MILHMRILAVPMAASLLIGCAGVSPLPQDLADRDLPEASTDPEVVAQVAEWTKKARLALDAQAFEEAEELAEEAISVDAGAWRARAVLGNALMRQSQAVQPPDLQLQNRGDGETLTAERHAPNDPAVGLLRVEFLAGTGHLSAAAAAGESFLERIRPNEDADYVGLLAATAGACYELGEERRALPLLQQLVGYRPDSSEAQFWLGYCGLQTAINTSQGDQAVRAFARCAELSPEDEEAQLALLAAYSKCIELATEAGDAEKVDGYRSRALQLCDQLAQRFANQAEPWFRRGVLLEAPQPEEAMAAYRKALDLDAEHLGALLNLASLLYADGEGAEAAKDLWRRALAADTETGGLTAEERRRILALLDK